MKPKFGMLHVVQKSECLRNIYTISLACIVGIGVSEDAEDSGSGEGDSDEGGSGEGELQ